MPKELLVFTDMSFKKINKKNNHNIRLLRLKTGEQLITKINNSNEDKLYLHRPMRINTVIMGEPGDSTGESRREIVFLNNWVEFSESDSIAIPKDIVFAILPPNNDTIRAYEAQKSKEDSWADDLSETPMPEGEGPSFEEVVSDVVEKIISSHFGLKFDEEEDWDESLIDKDREDYGNDPSDWSPYLDDYFG